jgi:hypothetical protein
MPARIGGSSATTRSAAAFDSVPVVDERRYPRYRVLTGQDNAAFCYRVSAALDLGYELHGDPALTFDGHSVIVGQALIWKGVGPPPEKPSDEPPP